MSVSAEEETWGQVGPAVAPELDLPTRARRLAPVLFACGLVVQVTVWGVPISRGPVLVWVLLGLVTFTSWSDTSGRATRVLRDWMPLILLLVLYDFTRGAADTLGMPVQEHLPEAFDRWLLGGQLPTAVLQDALIDAGNPAPWEALVSIVYMSHFIVPYVILGVLWARDRTRWAQAVGRYIGLTAAGLLTYVLVPAAPPWFLSRKGELERLNRTATRGWDFLQLDMAASVIERGQSSVNLVAALPSMHAAYPMLFAIILWPMANRAARAGLATYVVAMGFTLVLTGEHFVFDVFLGWTYAAMVCAIARLVQEWRANRAFA